MDTSQVFQLASEILGMTLGLLEALGILWLIQGLIVVLVVIWATQAVFGVARGGR